MLWNRLLLALALSFSARRGLARLARRLLFLVFRREIGTDEHPCAVAGGDFELAPLRIAGTHSACGKGPGLERAVNKKSAQSEQGQQTGRVGVPWMYPPRSSWINHREFRPAVLDLGQGMRPRDRTCTRKTKKANLLSEKQSGPAGAPSMI